MSAALAAAGWLPAIAALAALALARRAHARRMELVARACHELRGPLTAARLALHSLGRGRAALARPVAAIDLELRRAGLALEDLAAARRGRRAAERPEAIEVRDLLEETVAAWRPAALALGRDLALEAPPRGTVVHGDRLRLAQAAANLLSNALEHGNGAILVRARAVRGRVLIEVADGGSGLPAPVGSLTRDARAGRGERGRGLAIVSEIAERHGGRLAAAPSRGGARLALELPAAGRRER